MKRSTIVIALSAVLAMSAMLTACSGSSSSETTAAATTEAETTEEVTEVVTTEEEEAAEEETSASTSSNRLQDILDRGYIEVATEPYFAPNEFIDPTKTGDDSYVGSDIELAKYIADALGVELRIKPMDFTSVLGAVATGKYDIAISALAYTPERAETMNLSKGYYFGSEDPETAYSMVIRIEDADDIKTIDDLADKTIVVQNASIQEQYVLEQIPAYGKLNRVSSMNDALLMVQEGRADAVAVATTMAQLYMDSNPNCGMMFLPDFYFKVDLDTQGTRIGIPLGEDELTDRLNEIIDEVIEQDLYNQWYNEYSDYAKSLGIEF